MAWFTFSWKPPKNDASFTGLAMWGAVVEGPDEFFTYRLTNGSKVWVTKNNLGEYGIYTREDRDVNYLTNYVIPVLNISCEGGLTGHIHVTDEQDIDIGGKCKITITQASIQKTPKPAETFALKDDVIKKPTSKVVKQDRRSRSRSRSHKNTRGRKTNKPGKSETKTTSTKGKR